MHIKRWRVKLTNLFHHGGSTFIWRLVSLAILVLLGLNLRLMMSGKDKSNSYSGSRIQRNEAPPGSRHGRNNVRKLKGMKCEPVKISNPSFEAKGGWSHSGKGGYAIVSGTSYSGKQSIKVVNGGAKQTLQFPTGVRKFVFSAFSRNSGVNGKISSSYSLWCDIKLTDGKWLYGQHTNFLMKSGAVPYSWHERRLHVSNKKDITEVTCSLIFRNYAGGRAFFDHVRMWIFPEDVDFKDCKYTYLV